jgi:hypothetical protein
MQKNQKIKAFEPLINCLYARPSLARLPAGRRSEPFDYNAIFILASIGCLTTLIALEGHAHYRQ